MHRRCRSRCVGAIAAVPLGTAPLRGGTTTVASEWRSATAPYTSARSYAPSPVNEATGSSTWSSTGPTREPSSTSLVVSSTASIRPVPASTPRCRCYGASGADQAPSPLEASTERPMPQRNDLSRSDIPLEQQSTLIAVVEMSQSSWLVAGIVPGLERHPLKKLAPDEEALLRLLHRWRDEAARAGRAVTRVAVAFEAGRDGSWLARRRRARGVEAHVSRPTSVAVSREHRRAKTDRLDTGLLKRAFLGWLRGEPAHCGMAAIPTLEEEDARRPNREREGLVGERTRIVNRMKGALARLGIRGFKPTLRNAAERLAALCTAEGAPLPPNTLAELRRDMARLRLVRDQIRQVEEARLEALERQPATGRDAMLRPLARGVGGGGETAGMLVHEILSRGLRDPPAGARYPRPTGSPGQSGAGPPGGGALRRPDGIAGRERVEAAGEGARQVRQRPGAPGHDPAGLALPAAPEGQRARPLVPGAHRGRPRRRAQDADRGAGAEAPGRAVAAGDHGQGAGGPRPAAGVTGRIGQPHGKGFRRSATLPWRAADDGPRWR